MPEFNLVIARVSFVDGWTLPARRGMPDRSYLSSNSRVGAFDALPERPSGSEKPEPRDLLWIDDEIRPDDAIVRLLVMEGFRVDCAYRGTTGLAMADTGEYVGIILDLRLPDMPGLSVLETLGRPEHLAPVLVLTGYPDFDSAVQAMRLGAWDCQSKTILLDDNWVNVFRALAEHGDRARKRRAGLLSGPGAIVAELLDFLDQGPDGTAAGQTPVDDIAAAQNRLTSRLLHILRDPRTDVFLLLTCAKALRLVIAAPAGALSSVMAELSQLLRESARHDTATMDWRVQATISRLEEAGTGLAQLREEDLARTFSVNRAHLGRLLRAETGFTFRQWRWGYLLRPAPGLLATSREQVAQIAYRCGYASAAQFDRDFRRMFNKTPTEYRRLLQTRPA